MADKARVFSVLVEPFLSFSSAQLEDPFRLVRVSEMPVQHVVLNCKLHVGPQKLLAEDV